MHHFMSNSPWSGPTLVTAVQDDVRQHPEFQSGAILILDESAGEKAGNHGAGAARPHNGRLGKVEMSQVGVFLSLATPQAHTWIDGELYIPKHWFDEAHAERREKADIQVPHLSDQTRASSLSERTHFAEKSPTQARF